MNIDGRHLEVEKIDGIRQLLATGFSLAREASFDEIIGFMTGLAEESQQPTEVTKPVIDRVRALKERIAELLN
ncbi:hypothetical protein CO046_03340 [Candidatus Peregrinibacteria bacterium CG_4_9_14_0_2_um_filter_53_11]|nr:MAG: hypothetical protein CO046_03340 [Candidatus Peregrinibacteria bacterium CG_4_9_14_0_2_um_filter_53_11]